MKSQIKFILAISIIFILLLTGAFLYFFLGNPQYATNYPIYELFFAQLVAFSLLALVITIYCIRLLSRKGNDSIPDITKIAMLSQKTNEPLEEHTYHLANRTSALVCIDNSGKSGAVYLAFSAGASVSEEYATINRVGGYWYLERLSDERKVALKRVADQYIYNLKPSVPYKLSKDDIIYIENERMLVA